MGESNKDFILLGDNLATYSRLLNLESSRLPLLEEMPPFIDFPMELMCDLSISLSEMRKDGYERGQAIKRISGRTVYGEILIGSKNNLPFSDHEKALFFWHTHPDYDSRLSPGDSRVLKAFPNISLIIAVFDYSRGTFIFQTNKSFKTFRFPLRSMYEYFTDKYGDWNEKGLGYYTFDHKPDPDWGTESPLSISSIRLSRVNQFFTNPPSFLIR